MTHNSTHTEWCLDHFDSIKDGGVWIVPRSGLIFTRRGQTLVLTSRAPYMGDNPLAAELWPTYQNFDIRVIRTEFALAGIEVIDEEE